MKILRFFITKIFLKRWILVFGMIAMLFLANYLTFTTARSVFNTYQGYQEMNLLNKKGTFIANIDPNNNPNYNEMKLEDTQKVYDYLDENYDYAFHSDGFMINIKNNHSMDVKFSYINESAYKLKKIELSKGKPLNFNYSTNDNKIPILIGPGLSETYPLGSIIKTKNPVTQKRVNLEVTGILKKNLSRSNFYAPNSKYYYNFSIFFPVNAEFIKSSNLDLQVNGLMDLVILNSTKSDVGILQNYIKENTTMKFNFYTQKENFTFFEDYYVSSLKIMSLITFVLLLIINIIAVWNTLVSVRLMIKDFTINLVVGLSYSKLRKIFYSYFALLFSINLIILFVFTSYSRYKFWLAKDSSFATYGFLSLIEIDWISFFVVLVIDILIGVLIVEFTMRKIKSIPISIGVLK